MKNAERIAVSTVVASPRRGLSKTEAALYIGVSASKFDMLVNEGRMPKPKQIDRRCVWDIRDLDQAFDALTAGPDDANTWD